MTTSGEQVKTQITALEIQNISPHPTVEFSRRGERLQMEMNVKFRLSISFGVPTCFINVGSWEERAQVGKRGSFSESSFWSCLRWTAEISLNNSAFLAIIRKVKEEEAEELNYPNKIKTVWKTSSFCRWKKFSACLASHSNQSNPDARLSFSARSVHSWKLSSTAHSIVCLQDC